ncbi:DUF3455 domain-containing protein [Deinococcus sp.]|uniref:DUF3455 domain-containing protein n=1 Tax=Deinococcus sp. TaxID=47478 RepID=UPI0026011F1A|nr:DUF3455 domain-containing protein [Deinococcus sp.]
MRKVAFVLILGATSCSVIQSASPLTASPLTTSPLAILPLTTLPLPILPLPTIPDAIKVPAGQSLARAYLGRGTQNYACQKDAASGAYTWAFQAPEAELFGAQNVKVATHYGGPTWEAPDGSKVVGAVQARSESAPSIPWLLLAAKSTAGSGLFGKTTFIQRLSTTGGAAPTGGCDAAAGQVSRVPYTSVYAFYEAAVVSTPPPAY